MEQVPLDEKVRAVLALNGDAFGEMFPGSRERIAVAIAPAFENLRTALVRFQEADVQQRRQSATQPDGYSIAWHILWDACNGFLAAFVLLQRGYAMESLAVTRTVIERVACAIVLFDNPEQIPSFMSGKSDLSTKAIGPAGKVVTDLARTWGLLSEIGSHLSKPNVGTGFIGLIRGAGADQLHMAVGGNIPASGPEHDAIPDFIDELSNIAERLLGPAPSQIFFNERRQRAVFRRSRE